MVCPKCGRRTFKREAVCPRCGTAMPERKSIEINNTEGESDLNFFNRNKQKATSEAVEQIQPTYTPEPSAAEVPSASAETAAPEIYEPPVETSTPEIIEQSVEMPDVDASPDTSGYMPPEFYGSYGEVCNDTAQTAAAVEPEPTANEAAPKTTFSMTDFDIYGVTASDTVESSDTAEIEFNPILNFPGNDGSDNNEISNSDSGDDDELILPDIPAPAPSSVGESKKSMGYEDTVKLENARSAYGNEKPIHQSIKESQAVSAPKHRDYTAVASGTAHVSGDLPKLKEGQMYVAITPKELRLLRSRKFRGVGILATLCLVIISAFCIWSYANSFTDPLVGAWRGDVNAAYLPIEQIQQTDQDIIRSTWEFSSSGSLYLNIVVNETPISLSGTYEQKNDNSGEPYITMTLTNPVDSSDYSLDMYYTITGKILELNDTQGMGMTIDLIKE